ncbi:HutD family protein [Nocardioides sp.]|uniref:HutD/Ves family protein n=1 Tax=Nocardioides sp. TaxID=35761 RepID=UPI002BA3199D|nr:HutD family protein [Nocardioides sp.]HXH78323.1 HutD family protein [Nocardioides sp.]
MSEEASAPTVVRSAGVRAEPWSNGGGVTRELLCAEDGAWRVSMADIDRDGPFSAFPGRERLLTVVAGQVLALVVDGVDHVVEPRRPFAFAGGAEVGASLPDGPVRALNVMVDPAAVSPFVTVLELGRGSTLPLADDQAALILQGRARAGGADAAAYDLVVGPTEVSGRCTLAIVTLQRS